MAAVNISAEKFSQLMQEDRPVLVDYWAPWCSYCRRISAAYDKIAEEYGHRLEVVKINIDEEEPLSQREQIEVIPTLVIYKNGQALGSIVAPESKARIEEFIQQTLI